jgi:hypothetical protein
VTKLGETFVMFGLCAYLFAKLGRRKYQGGPAAWSPKFWRGQEMLGLVLLALGGPILIFGLLLGWSRAELPHWR